MDAFVCSRWALTSPNTQKSRTVAASDCELPRFDCVRICPGQRLVNSQTARVCFLGTVPQVAEAQAQARASAWDRASMGTRGTRVPEA